MHEGVCPSCQGTEIYAARDGVDIGEFGAVGLRPHLELDFHGAVALHQTFQFWAYHCVACGLVEFRLLDPAATAFVKQHWVRVTGKS
jgi:hypothetical protein